MKLFHPGGLVTISPLTVNALGPYLAGLAAPTSAVWNTASRAYFIPFRISRPFLVTQMGLHTGATASGNVDVGIFDASGKQLVVAGSTAQSASVNVQQTFAVQSLLLGAGLFYLAAVMDNTTGTVFRISGNNVNLLGMMASMNTAFPLPSQATFASVAAAFLPMVSATGRTVL